VRLLKCGSTTHSLAVAQLNKGSYARQRAGYGRAEIQVLDEAWNVVETIDNEEARPLV